MVEFFDCTVGELLEETARKHPDRDALVYSDRDLKYSYRELNARVDRLAKGMLALGIGKGDHVGIWATNVPDWLTVFYATARIGAVFVTVNTSYRPSELEYVMQQSDMKALFLIDGYRDTDYVQALYDLVPELKTMPKGSLQSARFPFLKSVVYIGPRQHRGMYSFAEVMDLADSDQDRKNWMRVKKSLDPHDIVNMQYTSGTTGFPKGVMLTSLRNHQQRFFHRRAPAVYVGGPSLSSGSAFSLFRHHSGRHGRAHARRHGLSRSKPSIR